MAQNRTKTDKKANIRPTFTTEERQNRLTAMAMDLAEQRLLDGTASNQRICHFLKLGSEKERLEREKLEAEVELQKVKAAAIEASEQADRKYEEAIKAMKLYSGVEEG